MFFTVLFGIGTSGLQKNKTNKKGIMQEHGFYQETQWAKSEVLVQIITSVVFLKSGNFFQWF